MRLWLKRIGYGVGVIVGLLLIAAGVVYAMSEARFRRTYQVPTEPTVAVSDDSATLARGAHLATTAGCMDCHGEGLRGGLVIDGFPMGRLTAYNLTSGAGGVGQTLTPAIIEHAVRHGIGPDGHALRLMPADDYQKMSDDDIRSLASYVTHVAPVNNVLPPSNVMLLPRTLMLAGAMPLLPAERMQPVPHTASAPPSGTTQNGEYLAAVMGCSGCHGPGLSGGKIPTGDPAWVPAANLTRAGMAGKWTEAEFVAALRTGKRPDGTVLKDPMPWKMVGQLSDEELHGIWLYIQSMPPRQFGNR